MDESRGTDAVMAGRSGVYRLDRLDADRLADAGWTVARLGRVDDLDSFYIEISEALALPSWFGHNLDALWEVLIDLERPTLLHLTDTAAFTHRQPEAWRRLSDLLAERSELPVAEAVPFAVVLTAPTSLD